MEYIVKKYRNNFHPKIFPYRDSTHTPKYASSLKNIAIIFIRGYSHTEIQHIHQNKTISRIFSHRDSAYRGYSHTEDISTSRFNIYRGYSHTEIQHWKDI